MAAKTDSALDGSNHHLVAITLRQLSALRKKVLVFVWVSSVGVTV